MICPYEPGKPMEEVRRELGLDRIIKLASNENPLGPSPLAIATLNRSNLQLQNYPDYDGWYLRQALADHARAPMDHLVLGAGSVELMRLIADAFLERADEAIMADICFSVYATVVRLAGGHPIEVPLDGQLDHDLERMLGAISPRTKLVFLASPNNPTGRLIPFVDLKSFVERLPPAILCVLDLAYWEYVEAPPDEDPHCLLTRHPNLIVLHTFSKVYGLAGLRVGYAIASSEVCPWLNRVRLPFSCSTAAQVAALASLEDLEHVRRSVRLNRESRELIARGAASLEARCAPSQANFVLADFRTDAEELFQRLLRRGIVVRPMRHPRLATCLRISTGTLEQTNMLLESLPDALAPGRPS